MTENPHASENPLLSDSSDQWSQIITAVGPPSILVVIASWLGPQARSSITAEDVWQETLLCAWRDRAQLEWRGVRAFRRWLLSIARNQAVNLLTSGATQKRGRGLGATSLSDSSIEAYAGPVSTTTPSQVAQDREAADVYLRVLDSLPEDFGEVVRLRLFEDLSLEEVAERTGLGVSGVRHRLRRGLGLYRQRLNAVLGESETTKKD